MAQAEMVDSAPTDGSVRDWGQVDAAWEGIREEIVDVYGTPARILRHDGPAGGTPQLFVHGLGGSALNWLEVLGPLSRHGPTVALDLPGFGRTPLPPGGSARVRANAGFVRAAARQLGYDRVVLYGNSMGGLIATLVAERAPELVERLVLVNPALPPPLNRAYKVPRRVATRILPAAVPGVAEFALMAAMRRRTPEDLLDESLAGVLGEIGRIRPALRAAFLDNVQFGYEQAWRRAALIDAARSMVHLVAGARAVWRAVEAVEAPTLLVWGDLDRLVPIHVLEGLLTRRDEWDSYVFEGVGHAPQVEVPDRFVEVVDAWLDDRLEPSDVAGVEPSPATA